MSMEHPKGLWFLFFMQLWERFAHFGIRAILILYMVKHLDLGVKNSGLIFGWFCGLFYLTPLLGGYLADRYLGKRKAIFIGYILIAIGTLALAFDDNIIFYPALILIVFGGGFAGPNMAALLGTLYEKNDTRKDSGYTYFYMSVNIGAFFAPLVCGYLGEKISWKYGFLAAGIGMLIAFLTYCWGHNKYLGKTGLLPIYKRENHIIKENKHKLTKEDKNRIAVIFIMALFMALFWAAFEQSGSSMTLFADRETNRTIFGWQMPASYPQAFNALYVILLAPLFSKMWIFLDKNKLNPSTPAKFIWGLLFLGFGFIVMSFAAYIFEITGPVSLLWLILVYLIHTVGELCIAPIGSSLVSKLAPARFLSIFMAIWMLSTAFSGIFGGLLAANYDSISHWKFFLIPAATAFGSAVVLLVLLKSIKRWMHGIN